MSADSVAAAPVIAPSTSLPNTFKIMRPEDPSAYIVSVEAAEESSSDVPLTASERIRSRRLAPTHNPYVIFSNDDIKLGDFDDIVYKLCLHFMEEFVSEKLVNINTAMAFSRLHDVRRHLTPFTRTRDYLIGTSEVFHNIGYFIEDVYRLFGDITDKKNPNYSRDYARLRYGELNFSFRDFMKFVYAYISSTNHDDLPLPAFLEIIDKVRVHMLHLSGQFSNIHRAIQKYKFDQDLSKQVRSVIYDFDRYLDDTVFGKVEVIVHICDLIKFVYVYPKIHLSDAVARILELRYFAKIVNDSARYGTLWYDNTRRSALWLSDSVTRGGYSSTIVRNRGLDFVNDLCRRYSEIGLEFASSDVIFSEIGQSTIPTAEKKMLEKYCYANHGNVINDEVFEILMRCTVPTMEFRTPIKFRYQSAFPYVDIELFTDFMCPSSIIGGFKTWLLERFVLTVNNRRNIMMYKMRVWMNSNHNIAEMINKDNKKAMEHVEKLKEKMREKEKENGEENIEEEKKSEDNVSETDVKKSDVMTELNMC